MRTPYFLFQSHLDLAHQYWERLVQPGDIVIDATCGNGQDTLKLARLALRESSGIVYAIDIQPKAIELTRQHLMTHLSPSIFSQVQLILGCHSHFPSSIFPSSVKLIVYNLGYLPGGDKSKTTQIETTLQSLSLAQQLIMPGGAISVACYPGHAEGLVEEDTILAYAARQPPGEWSCCHHRWLNRHKAPSLLLLQKGLKTDPSQSLPQYGSTKSND